MVSSSELDVIFSFDDVFFFFGVVFLADAVWARDSRNGPGGCWYLTHGEITIGVCLFAFESGMGQVRRAGSPVLTEDLVELPS